MSGFATVIRGSAAINRLSISRWFARRNFAARPNASERDWPRENGNKKWNMLQKQVCPVSCLVLILLLLKRKLSVISSTTVVVLLLYHKLKDVEGGFCYYYYYYSVVLITQK